MNRLEKSQKVEIDIHCFAKVLYKTISCTKQMSIKLILSSKLAKHIKRRFRLCIFVHLLFPLLLVILMTYFLTLYFVLFALM